LVDALVEGAVYAVFPAAMLALALGATTPEVFGPLTAVLCAPDERVELVRVEEGPVQQEATFATEVRCVGAAGARRRPTVLVHILWMLPPWLLLTPVAAGMAALVRRRRAA
jgi:hypothetical protein